MKDAGPKIRKVTNATRQSDIIFFKLFDGFLRTGDENLFMYLQSRLIRYEDRALFIEVNDLAYLAIEHFDRSYMKFIMTQVEAFTSCEAVSQTDMDNLKYLLGLIKEKLRTLTDFEFLVISKAVSENLPRFDHNEERAEFVKCLQNVIPDDLQEVAAKIGLEYEYNVDNVIKKASPKLQQVSEVTRQLNKQIFKDFADVSNPSNNPLQTLRRLLNSVRYSVIP